MRKVKQTAECRHHRFASFGDNVPAKAWPVRIKNLTQQGALPELVEGNEVVFDRFRRQIAARRFLAADFVRVKNFIRESSYCRYVLW
ncbi:hypothetical protein KJ068_04730 [bacterium]|nr:hypothetical protein [bacterium]